MTSLMVCSRLSRKCGCKFLNYTLNNKRLYTSVSRSPFQHNFMKISRLCKRTLIYEPDEKGVEFEYKHKFKTKYLMDKSFYVQGLQTLKEEVQLWSEEVREKFRNDPVWAYRHGEIERVWRFRTDEDFDKWIVTSDRDLNAGKSCGSLTRSPQGYAVFSGNLNTEVPKDGEIKRTGFVNLGCKPAMKSFGRATTWNWALYTHLVIRCRGDGRSYLINLHIHSALDILWFDTFHFALFTRGGPYWQESKIPLSKFYMGSKGRIQDVQGPPDLENIRKLSFTVGEGTVGGPFHLELDYIGLVNDMTHTEETAYEKYKVPYGLIGH